MINNRDYSETPRKGDITKAVDIKYDRLVGIEIEAKIPNEELAGPDIPKGCGASQDGGGREIQTPPASADKLEKMITAVCGALKKGNSWAPITAGLHIHLDGKGFNGNVQNSIRLTNTYYAIEPIIWAMLPHSRRKSSWCMPLGNRISEQEYRQLIRTQSRKDKYYLYKKWYKTNDVSYFKEDLPGSKGGPRYYGFNLHALLALKHLELRYHPGTVNADKIKNWIILHLLVNDWVLNNYSRRRIEKIRRAKTIDEKVSLFLNYFGVPELLKKYIQFRVKRCSIAAYEEASDDWSYSNKVLDNDNSMSSFLAVAQNDSSLYPTI